MKFKEKDIKKMGIALVVGIVIGLIAGVSISKAIYNFKNKETISIDYLLSLFKTYCKINSPNSSKSTLLSSTQRYELISL